MTGSHSSSLMLKSIRSRRIPATHTTPSIEPNVSTAVCTMRSPPAIVVTVSATATAWPPRALISATTSSAISLLGSFPSMLTPKSFTTTFAPASAHASATARPMPRPAPVIAIVLPSRYANCPALLPVAEGPRTVAKGQFGPL